MKSFFVSLFTLATFYSANAQSSTTVILNPGQNLKAATVRSNFASLNYSTYPELSVMQWTHNGNPMTVRAFVEFDLSSLAPNVIIDSAKLKLYNPPTGNNQGNHAMPNAMLIRKITQAWNHQTLTWNNMPNSTSQGEILVPSSASTSMHYNIDVTSLISDLHANPSQGHGFMMRLQTETRWHSVILASGFNSDSALHPRLEITYRLPCPTLSANFNSVVNGQNVAFNNSSTGSGPLSYRWNFGDGDSSNQASPLHFYNSPGTYQVCLETTDTCGTISYCDSITVTCSGTAQYTTQQSSGLQFSFSNQSTGTGSLSYLWDFGDGIGSTFTNPTHTYNSEGTYQVCLSTTDTCGTATHCDSLVVNCPGLSSYFTYLINGGQVSFNESASGAGIWEYRWDFGDGGFSFSQNPVYTYNSAGRYTVCLNVKDSCGERQYCEAIQICFPPNAGFSATHHGNTTVQFTPHNSASHLSYLWDFGDGNFNTAQQPLYTYQNYGVYQVCLEVSDTCLTESFCDSIEVSNLKLAEQNQLSVRVFPNPAGDWLQVEWDGHSGRLSLTDAQGRLCMERELPGGVQSKGFSLENLPAGVYLLCIHSAEAVFQMRLVKN